MNDSEGREHPLVTPSTTREPAGNPQAVTPGAEVRTMVLELRERLRERGAKDLDNGELIILASEARDPHMPSSCVEWAEREAVPLLHELAQRFASCFLTVPNEQDGERVPPPA